MDARCKKKGRKKKNTHTHNPASRRYVYANEPRSSSAPGRGSASSQIIKFNWLLRMTINPSAGTHISSPALRQISAGAAECRYTQTKAALLQAAAHQQTGTLTRSRLRKQTHTQQLTRLMPIQSSKKREIQFKVNSLHGFSNIYIYFQFGRILQNKNGFVN